MRRQTGYFSAARPTLEIRHKPSGLNSVFPSGVNSFPEYVLHCRDMIRKARASAMPGLIDADLLEKLVDGNAPFSLDPVDETVSGSQKRFRKGVLLTHGLSDSPYFMRHLAEHFQNRGFRVMAVLLPGHGTRPGDLLNVKWREWAKTVSFGVEKLAEEVEEIYLCGYSAGATLSINHCYEDKRIRGLFLFAPAMDVNHKAVFANMHKWISWLVPEKKWLEIKPDRDDFKYESFARNTAAQMIYLDMAVAAKMKLRNLDIPAFIVASEDDKTVDVSATMRMLDSLINPDNKMIVYTSDIARLANHSRQGRIEWVSGMFPDKKILSSAHTGILLSPHDEHYGLHGEYANCIHYYPSEMEKYLACMKTPGDCWLGEVNERNLKSGILRRLMFNPNFDAMIASLDKFLNKAFPE